MRENSEAEHQMGSRGLMTDFEVEVAVILIRGDKQLDEHMARKGSTGAATAIFGEVTVHYPGSHPHFSMSELAPPQYCQL